MTFNELFSQFQQKYDNTHDVIFFEILFKLSKLVNNKEDFIANRSIKLDIRSKKFWKLCEQYFNQEKPLAHIVGHTTFCDLEFQVSKNVLAPRDITEQMTKDFIDAHKNETDASVLDLCCGCGCIGISIKKYLPQMNVTCVDRYYRPFFNTHANALKHKTRITLDRCDAIKYLKRKLWLDYLISNPPYIDFDNFNNPQMVKWENKKALFAPDHGLYFYKQYFKWLANHKFKEAWLEVGYDLIERLQDETSKYPNLKFNFVTEKQYLIIKKEK